ncbi:MAG: glycosyltransferase family 1 protein [Ardenticatenia bacterium]|nr:glycosyltransferase family 1 protein [Ardenticatenia bacterium]
MYIAIDGSVIQAHLYGVSRYVYNLTEALAKTVLADDEIVVLYNPDEPTGQHRLEDLASLPQVALRPASGLGGKVRGPLSLVSQLRQLNVDVFHSPYYISRLLTNVPSVITVHDLSTFQPHLGEGFRGRLSQFTAHGELRLLRRAAAVICVSRAVKEELLRISDVPADRVRVVYNGVDHRRFHPRYRPEARQRAALMLGIEPPYVLVLASPEPRKNIGGVLRAYARLPREKLPKLVLAGAADWGHGPIYRIVQELGLEPHVRFTGYVPETILPDLYSGARLFVLPSLYEGFGLPVLEALACATPVVASNRGGIPEVAGDAAILVDPESRDAIAMPISLPISVDSGPDRARSNCLPRASAVRPSLLRERTAKETRDVYESVMS